MCLAVPARIIEINGDLAKVDFGGGVIREANVSLVDAKVGDYVLVHAGYAIQVLEKEEAEETLMLWKEILETEEGREGNAPERL
ncbi:MAG: HypC/HybG/HupF family hydrogenase formation chaperone [Candidatus Bathyarchaeia archaeon]